MDNRVIYISYATKNTPYIEVLNQYLIPTLQKFNLPYDIAYPDSRGNWKNNTHMKAEIIKEMLLKHKQSIVFLDADATIERYPEIFDTLQDYDIGVHYFDYKRFWHGQLGGELEVLSGTLYLNYNDKILSLINDWIVQNKIDSHWEQKNLQKVLKLKENELRIFPLPIEYIAIVKPTYKPPSFIKEPVILHHQASRLYKNKEML